MSVSKLLPDMLIKIETGKILTETEKDADVQVTGK